METPPATNLPQKKHEEPIGPLVGIIIIVLLIAAGGIYFLVVQEMHRQATPPATQEQALLR
jgi:uncharacterized protein HemX